jgi:hypothetical protein
VPHPNCLIYWAKLKTLPNRHANLHAICIFTCKNKILETVFQRIKNLFRPSCSGTFFWRDYFNPKLFVCLFFWDSFIWEIEFLNSSTFESVRLKSFFSWLLQCSLCAFAKDASCMHSLRFFMEIAKFLNGIKTAI